MGSFFASSRCPRCGKPACFSSSSSYDVVKYAFAKTAEVLLKSDPIWERHLHMLLRLDADYREGTP